MNRTGALLIAGLAVVAALVAAARAPGLANSIQDDGFIYFRIAENAAAGNGPVFNPGERVDAATSPAWVWILAAAAALDVPLHVAAAALGLLAAVVSVLACGRWALELTTVGAPAGAGRDRTAQHGLNGHPPHIGVLAITGALALALDDRVLAYAFSGMETLLCAGVWLWATRALVRRWIQELQARGAGWWALAAALVRPEFVILASGVGLAAVVRARSRRASLWMIARTLTPALVGGVAYLGAHALYFGDPLPNTYYAKRALDWEHARIGFDYVVGFVGAYPWVALVPIALLARSIRPVVASVGLALLLFSAHVVRLGGDHFEFHRMFIHVLPICAALAGAGAACIVRDNPVGGTKRALRAARTITVTAAVVSMLLLSSRTHVSPDGFQWVQVAARLGAALANTYPPETRIGLFALGATGYTSRLPVIDALGIADRHVARQDLSSEHVCHLDIGHERGDPEYVLARADVVVLFAAYSPVEFESLEEVRGGFYSHKKFVAAAKEALRSGRFVLRNIEFMPGAHWAVLERNR